MPTPRRLAAVLALALAGCDSPPPPPPAAAPPSPPPVAAPPAPPVATVGADAIVIGERQTFRSDILGEDRTIQIYTPPGYRTGGAAYPVLYLLDGEAHFHHVTGLVDFLGTSQRAPGMIVVGVTNTARDRDFTPTAIAERPASGGGEKFLRFLADEVAPRIERTYRTVPYRILVGHSLGGLFAVYALTARPTTFQAYVSISPSLWWDDERMRRDAEKLFAASPDLAANLYLTIGDEPGQMLDSNRAFADMLKARAPKNLAWTYTPMPREDHGSLVHRTVHDALEALFTGWSPPAALDSAAALEAHYAALSRKFRFEVKPPEGAVNIFAYGLLAKQPAEALAAFELNVRLYPGSANVHDSLAEAQEKTGKPELALANYEKAVAIAARNADPLLPLFERNLARARESGGAPAPR